MQCNVEVVSLWLCWHVQEAQLIKTSVCLYRWLWCLSSSLYIFYVVRSVFGSSNLSEAMVKADVGASCSLVWFKSCRKKQEISINHNEDLSLISCLMTELTLGLRKQTSSTKPAETPHWTPTIWILFLSVLHLQCSTLISKIKYTEYEKSAKVKMCLTARNASCSQYPVVSMSL